jgi:exonuclease III
MVNNDYLFATEELARQLVSMTVMNGDGDMAWQHSDHAPMIANFGL